MNKKFSCDRVVEEVRICFGKNIRVRQECGMFSGFLYVSVDGEVYEVCRMYDAVEM